MTNKTNIDLDRLIKEALSEEDEAFLQQLEEPGLTEMLAGIYKGKMKWINIMAVFVTLIFLAVGVWCGLRFFAAQDVLMALRWASGAFFCLLVVMGNKIWAWLSMISMVQTREVKRLEFQVATLVRILRESRDNGPSH